jgi:hypothetical protein
MAPMKSMELTYALLSLSAVGWQLEGSNFSHFSHQIYHEFRGGTVIELLALRFVQSQWPWSIRCRALGFSWTPNCDENGE